ncbi:unnamed protein product [Knipowitschia caucasica]|uniref:Uncharacterized protein n=1 Tax=Knipowitschia caucasica TaxID=637954 RepID=A0AAV2L510_KNICA
MESVGSQGSCAGAPRLLLVPSPIHPDLQVDLDEEDEDIVIGIRPKSSPQPRRKTSISEEESDLSEPPSLSGSRRVSFAGRCRTEFGASERVRQMGRPRSFQTF